MTIPLTDRTGDAVLFRLPGCCVRAEQFAADALRLADALPATGHAINLCAGRYAFAVGFAAALLRGHPCLLTGQRSPGQVQALAERFPASYAIVDAAERLPLPAVPVPPPGTGTAAIPAVPAEQVAALAFTSGSTGEPVAHAKTWRALAERSRDAAVAFGWDADCPVTVVGTVPPHHMYGFETTVLLPLHAPAASWCGPAFYPADVRAALAACGHPGVLVTTPLQLRGLLAAPAMPPVTRVISATAPLEAALAERVERSWQTELSEIFGATEVGSIAHRRTTAGPLWRTYPRVTLSAADEGVVVEAPGAAPIGLADLVELVPGGFHFLGRRADLVKMGGRRASLTVLNRALTAIEGGQDGVFLPPGAEEPEAGARMTAVVVAPSQAADKIISALRGQIDPVFLPRRVVHVERMPRNAMGKLPLGELRALVQRG